jgi:stearoyl-CoA desaturase (delta-9 desaturase)
MNRAAKIANLGAMVVPFVATLAAIVLLWGRVVSWHDLALFGVMYVVTAAGITVGYHRMLTHLRTPPVRLPRLDGVRRCRLGLDHRSTTFTPTSRNTPTSGTGEGVTGVLQASHAHMGWLLSQAGRLDATRPTYMKTRACD